MAFASEINNTFDPSDLSDIAHSEILKRLEKYNIKGLPEVLVAQNAVIAGSFPLQCATGQQWEKSDIDIFVEQKNAQPLHDHFKGEYSLCYDSKDASHSIYSYAIINKITTYWFNIKKEYDLCHYVSDDQLEYRSFSETGPCYLELNTANIPDHLFDDFIKIQIIELPDNINPVEHVLGHFDIDICKITYTGSAVLYPLLIEKALSNKASFDDDKNDRSGGPQVRILKQKNSARIKKYEKRGFAITLEKHDEELTHVPLVKSSKKC